jgi:hypothetical protein
MEAVPRYVEFLWLSIGQWASHLRFVGSRSKRNQRF